MQKNGWTGRIRTEGQNPQRKNAKMALFNSNDWTGRIRLERSDNDILAFPVFVKQKWLDRQDSNLRMLGPKPSALPLGDGPILANSSTIHQKSQRYSHHKLKSSKPQKLKTPITLPPLSPYGHSSLAIFSLARSSLWSPN